MKNSALYLLCIWFALSACNSDEKTNTPKSVSNANGSSDDSRSYLVDPGTLGYQMERPRLEHSSNPYRLADFRHEEIMVQARALLSSEPTEEISTSKKIRFYTDLTLEAEGFLIDASENRARLAAKYESGEEVKGRSENPEFILKEINVEVDEVAGIGILKAIQCARFAVAWLAEAGEWEPIPFGGNAEEVRLKSIAFKQAERRRLRGHMEGRPEKISRVLSELLHFMEKHEESMPSFDDYFIKFTNRHFFSESFPITFILAEIILQAKLFKSDVESLQGQPYVFLSDNQKEDLFASIDEWNEQMDEVLLALDVDPITAESFKLDTRLE